MRLQKLLLPEYHGSDSGGRTKEKVLSRPSGVLYNIAVALLRVEEAWRGVEWMEVVGFFCGRRRDMFTSALQGVATGLIVLLLTRD